MAANDFNNLGLTLTLTLLLIAFAFGLFHSHLWYLCTCITSLVKITTLQLTTNFIFYLSLAGRTLTNFGLCWKKVFKA